MGVLAHKCNWCKKSKMNHVPRTFPRKCQKSMRSTQELTKNVKISWNVYP